MKIKALTSAVALAALMSMTAACASTGGSGDKAMYEQALKAAQQSREQALAVKNNWTPINNLIKEAEELAKKGEFAEATKKLERADWLAQRAVEQHESQPNPGPWR